MKKILILISLSMINCVYARNTTSVLTLTGQSNPTCYSGFGSSLQPIAQLDFGNLTPGQTNNSNISFFLQCAAGTVINGINISSQNNWKLSGTTNSDLLISYNVSTMGEIGVGYTGGLFISNIDTNSTTNNLLNVSSLTMNTNSLGTTFNFSVNVPKNSMVDIYKDTLTVTTLY